MASWRSIPRYLLPSRAQLPQTTLPRRRIGLGPSAAASLAHTTSIAPFLGRRCASSSVKRSPQGQIVLEQPDKFRPPSHPARKPRRSTRWTYGPELSEKEKQAQGRRQYPNMMPPEGSFLYWFLLNRKLHAFITISVLVSLAFFTLLSDFLRNLSPSLRPLLPDSSAFLNHPFASFSTTWQIYREHISQQTAAVEERRQRFAADTEKRRAFRRAHGIDEGWVGQFGWFDSDPDAEERRQRAMRRARGEDPDAVPSAPAAEEAKAEVREEVEQLPPRRGEPGGKPKPKKWFGIWE
ncbi:hypothetical protein BDY21DRAFT_279045 [Lineolata rhizophorae]|uniref:Uncharacterized protein n=1 Tax=Lineolata rhizophorae TaxID=578093 RepID=A0A6A6PB59_9PEZI|nr:hypothetical protein BDY21DRAFT_279045 [Lineolata rhizophorae]